MRSRYFFFLFLSLLFYIASGLQEEVVLAIVVEPRKTECFFQDLTNPKYVAFEIDYQVTDGGGHDIRFLINNPAGAPIIEDVRKTDSNHRIDVVKHGRGDYAICFDNTFSLQAKKTVFFEIYMLDENGDYLGNYDMFAEKEKVKQQMLTQVKDFERITTKVKNNLNQIEQLQSQFRAIESRDRSVMEHNFEMVNFWSCINMVVMVSVSGLQLYLLRSLFEEDSRVGRFIRSGKVD